MNVNCWRCFWNILFSKRRNEKVLFEYLNRLTTTSNSVCVDYVYDNWRLGFHFQFRARTNVRPVVISHVHIGHIIVFIHTFPLSILKRHVRKELFLWVIKVQCAFCDLDEKSLLQSPVSFLIRSFRKSSSHFIKYCVKLCSLFRCTLVRIGLIWKQLTLCSHEITFRHEETTGKYEIFDIWKTKFKLC